MPEEAEVSAAPNELGAKARSGGVQAGESEQGPSEAELGEKRWKWVQQISRGLLAALAVQFLLGLWTNVYAGPTSYPPTLEFHFLFGYIVGILSLAMLVLSFLTKELRLWLPSLIVLVGVIIAAVDGLLFLGNPNAPIFSFLMGVGFLISFSAATFVHSASLTRSVPVVRSGASAPT